MEIATMIFSVLSFIVGVVIAVVVIFSVGIQLEFLKDYLSNQKIELPSTKQNYEMPPVKDPIDKRSQPKFPIPDGSTDTFEDGFNIAKDHFWYILQLSIYDMYRKMEILDFDVHMGEIGERMNSIMDDEDLRMEVVNELREYFEEGEE